MEEQRFASLTDEEIQHILDEKDSANSLKGSRTSFGTLMKYCKENIMILIARLYRKRNIIIF